MARSILLPEHTDDVQLPGYSVPKKYWPMVKKWLEARAKVGETYADTLRRIDIERACDWWARSCYDEWRTDDRAEQDTDVKQAEADLTTLKVGI